MIVSLVETFFHKRYKVNLHKDYLLIENVNFFFRLTRASSTTRWAARKISDLYSHQTKNERERRKERLRNKFLAVATCILMAGMMLAPIGPVNAKWAVQSWMNTIQYRYFATQDSLFTALMTPDSSGGVDVMGWPLTQAEYDTALSNNGIVVEPLPEAGEFEMAFNNNVTDGINMAVRSPMNFTDFRNAMNCLIDSNGVIAGPILGGFATRDYTQIPEPLMAAFVNPAVSGANYPWEFNVTHALQILYNGGWYNTTTYQSFASLLAAYGGGTGPLSAAGGTTSGVIYPSNDINDQGWGLIDTNTLNTAFGVNDGPLAYTAEGVAGQAIQPLVGYVRTNDARKNLGDFFCDELKAIGCPYVEYGKGIMPFLFPHNPVEEGWYDFATL